MLSVTTLQAVILDLSWSQKVGQYLSPPDELTVIGRQLKPSSYGKLLGQISPEEELFGLYDRGNSLVAPRLSSIQEFNHYEAQYRRKVGISRTFWAVPKEAIALGNYGIYRRQNPAEKIEPPARRG